MLGDSVYQSLMSRLKPDEHAIFLIANGLESFKGSGFVRGGIYDRVQVAQDMDTSTFRDLDYLNLYGIEAAGAPSYQESAIFIIRSPTFSGAYPWSLVFLANKMDRQTGSRTFVNFAREYWLPGRYLEGGRPEIIEPEATWVTVWKSRKVEVVLFLLWLTAAGTVYALREKLVRRSTMKDTRWKDYPKVSAVDYIDRLRRVLPAGRAIHHAGADLVPLHPVRMALGIVPVRSVRLPVLDFHHHFRVFLGTRDVLRLDVSLRLALGT